MKNLLRTLSARMHGFLANVCYVFGDARSTVASSFGRLVSVNGNVDSEKHTEILDAKL